MVLLITNKEDITTDFIVKELKRRKLNYYRLNTEDILLKNIYLNFENNKFEIYDKYLDININFAKTKSIYFRRPKLPDLKDDLTIGEKRFFLNELNFLLEGIYSILGNKYWISPINSIRKAENKSYQLLIAQKIGFNIPDSIISNNYETILSFVLSHDNNCIIKPIKVGFIEESNSTKFIYTSNINSKIIKKYKNTFFYPYYIQSKIIKTADIRVTVIGSKVFAAAILSQEFNETQTDWRKSPSTNVHHEKITLPLSISEKCIYLTKKLGLKFGAIDLILGKDNKYTFLEINPNGQWAWIERRLDYNLSESIVNLLINRNE